MDIEYDDPDLARLEIDSAFNAGHAEAVVHGFRKAIQLIRAAQDERDLRAFRSLNFEKLKGKRQHQYSVRINKQWRLIFTIKKTQPKNTIVAIEIADYH